MLGSPLKLSMLLNRWHPFVPVDLSQPGSIVKVSPGATAYGIFSNRTIVVPSHEETSIASPALAPVSHVSTPPLNQLGGAGLAGKPGPTVTSPEFGTKV